MLTVTVFVEAHRLPFAARAEYLPSGRVSSKLVMPSEFVAQNGAVMKQSTKIAVTGCPKAVRHERKKKHTKKKKK